MDVAAAIEHRYGVRFTERELFELTSVADVLGVAAAAAPGGAPRAVPEPQWVSVGR